MADAEIDAMHTCLGAIAPLEDAQQRRVLAYLNARFTSSARAATTAVGTLPTVAQEPRPMSAGADGTAWANFGDLFYAFKPTSNSEKALVAGYWLQTVQGKPAFKSNQANMLLKDLGEQIPHNIQRDYDRMIQTSPSLVVLQAGSGAGRRLYKLTVPGIETVQSRLGRT